GRAAEGRAQASLPRTARCSSTAARSRSVVMPRAGALLAGIRAPSAEQGGQRAPVDGGELVERHREAARHLQAAAPGRAQGRGGAAAPPPQGAGPPPPTPAHPSP